MTSYNQNSHTNKGRPKNEFVDSVRGILWFRVTQESSKKTAYGLEKEFSGKNFKKNQYGETVRPCQWNKYSKGKSIPNPKLVDEVNDTYPGGKYWLNHPLWNLLRKKLPSNEALKIILSDTRPSLVKHIGETNDNAFAYTPTKFTTLNSLTKIKAIDIVENNRKPLNAILTLLIITIDTEQKQYRREYLAALESFLDILPIVVNTTRLHLVKGEFLELIQKRFIGSTPELQEYFSYIQTSNIEPGDIYEQIFKKNKIDLST